MPPSKPHQESYFAAAEPDHFAWQTDCPYVSDRERALVRTAFLPLGRRVLDLGCGEGATFHHLGAGAGAVGIDTSEQKVRFAAEALPQARFVVASAEDLPFDDGSFEQVIVRDVIHHLPSPDRMVEQAWRVLAPAGRLDVLEPCAFNPLIALHALSVAAERGELRSTPARLSALVSRRFSIEHIRRLAPLPIHRVLFHPTLGSPRLARHGAAQVAVAALEQLAGRVMPPWAYSYIHLRAHRDWAARSAARAAA